MPIRLRRNHILFASAVIVGLVILTWELFQLSATVRVSYFQLANQFGAYDSLVKSFDDDRTAGPVAELLVARGTLAVPALIRGIDHPALSVRLASMSTLGRIGPAAKDALPILLGRLKSPGDEPYRNSALSAICQIGKGNPIVIAELLSLLETGDEPIQYSILDKMAGIGATAAEAVPLLQKRLGDESFRVRVEAAEALGNYGAEAKSAIPALLKALKDPKRKVRSEAAQALTEILGESAKKDPKLSEEVNRAIEEAKKDERS